MDPTLVLPVLALLAGAPPATSPARTLDRDEGTLAVEPVALSIRYLHAPSQRWQVGATFSVGPFEGVTLHKGDSGKLREWATLYPVVALRPRPEFALLLSPIGAALAIGDDFSSVYPSAQAGLELAHGRLRVGSDLRVIRVAGGDGSGDYWTQWIPLRVGITF